VCPKQAPLGLGKERREITDELGLPSAPGRIHAHTNTHTYIGIYTHLKHEQVHWVGEVGRHLQVPGVLVQHRHGALCQVGSHDVLAEVTGGTVVLRSVHVARARPGGAGEEGEGEG